MTEVIDKWTWANWLALSLIVALLALKTAHFRQSKGHQCPWVNCPYKGVKMADRSEAISAYTGTDEGSDSFCVDYLHFEYPGMSYDQLETYLFTGKKP